MYQISYFNTREDAILYRHEHGGWIFASENGDFIHFPAHVAPDCAKPLDLVTGFTPTRIMMHPATRGQCGEVF